MRLAWVSPLPPQKSGIATYSLSIIKELSKYVELDVWTDFPLDQGIYYDVNLIHYKPSEEFIHRLRNEYDAVIYNMGNNYLFHSNIYELIKAVPGITILHDYVLSDFFRGYFLDYKKDFKGFYNFVSAYYPENANEVINGLKESSDRLKYPLCEPVVYRSTGVIVHSEFTKNLVSKFATCPVKVLYHPTLPIDLEPSDRHILRDGRFKVLIAGDITENKKVYDIIKCISESEFLPYLRKTIRLIIVGEGPDKQRVEHLIASRKLGDFISLEGRVRELDYYISKSDICINLRYPSFGETSGVLIRCMQLGKPVVVLQTGFYKELPNDVVIKIESIEDIYKIPIMLYRFLEDRSLLHEVGHKAKEYVYREHSLSRFVYGLLSFVPEAERHTLVLNTILDLRDKISEIIGCPNTEYGRKLISEISGILEDIL